MLGKIAALTLPLGSSLHTDVDRQHRFPGVVFGANSRSRSRQVVAIQGINDARFNARVDPVRDGRITVGPGNIQVPRFGELTCSTRYHSRRLQRYGISIWESYLAARQTEVFKLPHDANLHRRLAVRHCLVY